MNRLNGKKVIFIGNSFTFFGGCVSTNLGQPSKEAGYFEKLVAAMGDAAEVTNFTYGGAGFVDGRSCAEKDGLPADMEDYGLYQLLTLLHPGYVGNPSGLPVEDFYRQDVVVLQQRGENLANTYDDAKRIAALFEGTPTMAFLMVSFAYLRGHQKVIDCAERLSKDGYLVVKWGKAVYDCIQNGSLADLPCDKNSFIVDKNERDGFHPNDLSGWITAAMLYSRLTGIPTADLPYDFVQTDKQHYTHGPSNFDQILATPAAMTALCRACDALNAEN